jgi:tetratricopeptide (TPR) repeat protein
MVERLQLANISDSLSSLNLYYGRRGSLDESEAAFLRAATRLGDESGHPDPLGVDTLAGVLTARAGQLRQRGRYAEAVELLTRVLGSLESERHAAQRAYALVEQGSALLWAGDPAAGVATTALGVALFRRLDDAWGLVYSLDRLGSVCGGYCGGAGDYARAELVYREGLALQGSLGAIVLPSTLAGLGFVLSRQGNYTDGCRLMQDGLERIESAGDTWNSMAVRLSLANAQRNLGDYVEAELNAKSSLALARQLNSWEFETWAHYQLGDILKEQGFYDAALAEFQAGYVRARAANDTGRIAVAKLNFGDLALLRGEFDEARGLLEESLSCFEAVRETWGIVLARDGLGYLACRTERHAAARSHLRAALVAALDARLFPYIANILAGVALLHVDTGQTDRALQLLGLVQHHPATERHTLARRVEPTLTRLKGACSERQVTTGLEQGRTLELEAVTQVVIDRELG